MLAAEFQCLAELQNIKIEPLDGHLCNTASPVLTILGLYSQHESLGRLRSARTAEAPSVKAFRVSSPVTQTRGREGAGWSREWEGDPNKTTRQEREKEKACPRRTL